MAKRDYKREYQQYHGKPEQIANRAKRNAARTTLKNELGAKALKGKDVDHKVPLSKGGSNARRNLRVLSKSENRARK